MSWKWGLKTYVCKDKGLLGPRFLSLILFHGQNILKDSKNGVWPSHHRYSLGKRTPQWPSPDGPAKITSQVTKELVLISRVKFSSIHVPCIMCLLLKGQWFPWKEHRHKMHGGLLSYPTNLDHVGPLSIAKNNFKAASQLHRLHPRLMLVISTKEDVVSERKPPESHTVITSSSPGLKVEDRIRRQLSLECFEFPECRSWWCAKPNCGEM